MTLYLYRHGETEWNRQKRYLGRTDLSLAPEGVAKVKSMGENREVRRVYTSTLRRTMETAAIWFPEAELVPIAGFDEMDFGEFEGGTYEELMEMKAYRDWLDSGGTLPCSGGESMAGFCGRVWTALKEILPCNGEEPLVIVAHGGTQKAILSRWAKPERDYFDWQCAPGEGYSLCMKTGVWSEMRGLL